MLLLLLLRLFTWLPCEHNHVVIQFANDVIYEEAEIVVERDWV